MARKRKRLNAFGMSSSERFVLLRHWLLNSAAWQSLSLGARCLLIELWHRHNGQNNGYISFSVREAAEKLGVTKDTAAKWFRELVEKVFLKPRKIGSFDYKQRHATEWIITAEPYNGERATKDFMRWKPAGEKQTTVLMRGTDGPNQRDRGAQKNPSNGPVGPTERDREPPKLPSDGPTERDTYSIPGGGCSAEHPLQTEKSNIAELPSLPAFLERRWQGG